MAILVTEYCLPVSEGKKIGIVGNDIAKPLIQQLYKQVLLKKGYPEVYAIVDGLEEILYTYAMREQLTYVSPFLKYFLENIDGIIRIHAESNVKRLSTIPPERIKERDASQTEIISAYAKHVRPGGLTIIPYPTQAFAQEAEMSFFEYEDFVGKACFLDKRDPVEEWKKLSEEQERIIKELDKVENLRFVGYDTMLNLSVKGRKWINADGHINMPDGEIFTSPIENSAEGVIRFTYPGIYGGKEIENVLLFFEKGKVVKAKAEKGEDFLNQLLKVDEGAARVGEIAFGTNKNIRRFTKNVLFDEKMGNCIHLALGRGFPMAGGENFSNIHLDLLKDMTSGEVYADGKLIYKNGEFLI
jgi:aminopeptidase